jgi:hypothetical protein
MSMALTPQVGTLLLERQAQYRQSQKFQLCPLHGDLEQAES